MDIGSKIKFLCEKANISPRQLALSSGLAPSYIHDLINNKSNPTIEKLSKICAALNITLVGFLQDVEAVDPVVVTPELSDLVDNLRRLTPEQQQNLNFFLASMLPNRKAVIDKIDGDEVKKVIDVTKFPEGETDESKKKAHEIARAILEKQNKK